MKKIAQNFPKGRKLFFLILVLVFVFALLTRKNNVFTWMKAGFEVQSQKKEIRMLQENINALDKGIEDMQNSKDAAEKYAREELGFCAQGEDVYLVEE